MEYYQCCYVFKSSLMHDVNLVFTAPYEYLVIKCDIVFHFRRWIISGMWNLVAHSNWEGVGTSE